jgi:hypothetical protein
MVSVIEIAFGILFSLLFYNEVRYLQLTPHGYIELLNISQPKKLF